MAMVQIADRDLWHGLEAVPLSHIADRQNISLAYLEQLFLKLRRADLVESTRGRAGGYRLARPAAAITLRAIMAAVEEETAMTRCSHQKDTPCRAGQRCDTHDLWSALGKHIDAFLSSVTLADVIEGRFEPQATPDQSREPSNLAVVASTKRTIEAAKRRADVLPAAAGLREPKS